MRTRALVALVVLVLGGCTTSGPPRPVNGEPRVIRDDRHRLAVTLPDDRWRVAQQNLTPWLTAPREILSAGTFVMRASTDPEDGLRPFDAPVAPAALATMTSRDAFISVQESSPVGHPADDRPKSFRDVEDRRCCTGREGDYPFTWWWVPFVDEGRAFYVFVAIGNDASTATTSDAWSIADSLTFEPSPAMSPSS